MKNSTLYSVIAVVLGASLFVFGGYDDSPGAQLLGVLVVVVGVVFLIRGRKNNTD